MVAEVKTPKEKSIHLALSIAAGIGALVLALVIPQLAPHHDLRLIMLMLVLLGAGSLAIGILEVTTSDALISLKPLTLGFVLMILGGCLSFFFGPTGLVVMLLGLIFYAVNIATGIYYLIWGKKVKGIPASQQNRPSNDSASPGIGLSKRAFCSECGERLGEGDSFCASCGAQVGSGE